MGQPVLQAATAAAALVHTARCQPAWFVDLARIRHAGGDYLATRSANTRQQLRRSERFFQSSGPVVLQHAETSETAHAMLDQMATLHQATWESRGKPGSFAAPLFTRFHHALIEAGFPRREVTLARVSSGQADHRIFCIISPGDGGSRHIKAASPIVDNDNRAKPGLTCHFAAIRDALATRG